MLLPEHQWRTLQAAARRWVDLFEEDGSLNHERVDGAVKAVDALGPGEDLDVEVERAIFAFLSAALPEQGEP